jgi:hypothetical protein
MNRKLAYSLLGAGALLLTAAASDAQAFELLGQLFRGRSAACCDSCDCGCAVEPSCGVAEPSCGAPAECGCEPSCCEPCCRKPRRRLLSCLKLSCLVPRCCKPACCEPACCEPACEPVCCEPCCCKPKRGCCDWLRGLFHHRPRCAPSCCAADCGCEAPISCGCGG